MHILVCPDKFKGSLTASQVCQAIEAGIHREFPEIRVTRHPMSDGGDGMLDILIDAVPLKPIDMVVADPLFRPIETCYGIDASGDTAYVEMAKASGLGLLDDSERNCLESTTLGTGELVLNALRLGVRRLVLGVGGSATNDAGMGVAAALGYRFFDKAGNELLPVGKSLCLIDAIDDAAIVPELGGVEIAIACDVQNPFYGPDGAARTFARQKGADAAGIDLLDRGLVQFARAVKQKWDLDLQQIAGSGAAGGLAGGAVALLHATLESGIAMMIDATHLEQKVLTCDLLITGEGRLDEQTLNGKLVDGVIRTARKYDKPVAALCGASTLSPDSLRRFGISYCAQIMQDGRSLEDAMANGYQYLEDCAATLITQILSEVGR